MASINLKEKIKKHLIETGYYEKSIEQKLKEHQNSYDMLSRIEKGDYNKGKKYLGY